MLKVKIFTTPTRGDGSSANQVAIENRWEEEMLKKLELEVLGKTIKTVWSYYWGGQTKKTVFFPFFSPPISSFYISSDFFYVGKRVTTIPSSPSSFFLPNGNGWPSPKKYICCLYLFEEEERAGTKAKVSTEPITGTEEITNKESITDYSEDITEAGSITKSEIEATVGLISKAAADTKTGIEVSAETEDSAKAKNQSGLKVGAGNIDYSNEALNEEESVY